MLERTLPDGRASRICFAYYWATSGGVERVFLNRSEALLQRDPNLQIDLYFHDDLGGLSLIERYAKARRLRDRLKIARTFDPSRYDSIFLVDSPQLLWEHPAVEQKMIMECHTPYAEARTYLAEWQNRLKILVVPSSGFVQVVEREYPGLRGKVKVVRNFIPRFPVLDRPLPLPSWQAPLFLYFARYDELKNFDEFVAGISSARQHSGVEPLGLACGQMLRGYPPQKVIEKHGARGSVIALPAVPFENSHILMQMVRQKRGVFVSCSKGESFGLSAAEAMSAGLPVILSDIPPHSALVSHREKFLYRLGDVRQLAKKMTHAIEHYDALAAECGELSGEFSEQAFLSDWDRLSA
ncbi:MAG TPA: glycosyltransferase family 4 protein [Bryobacteraceae bacterium]|nr:glycosyltransferase family 4 protein [Bryobacteraceae bacterium]